MKPKISVVVAAYNVAEFLPECLDSLIRQTYENIEIIVVDDGATDRTAVICDEYAELDKRVRVVHQENQGLSVARNVGIGKSRGEWVCLVDGDDYVEWDYVEKMYESAKLDGAQLVMCGFRTVPSGEVELPSVECLTGEEAACGLLTEQKNYQIVAWNKLYKRELFDEIKFPEGKIHEDNLTTYKLLAAAQKVAMVDGVLYNYRKRRGSIMDARKLEERLTVKLEAAEEAKKYFSQNGELQQAAGVAELLAYLAFLDNIVAGRLTRKAGRYMSWVREHKKELLGNPMMTKKLKSYVKMISWGDGLAYKIFRKIKN